MFTGIKMAEKSSELLHINVFIRKLSMFAESRIYVPVERFSERVILVHDPDFSKPKIHKKTETDLISDKNELLNSFATKLHDQSSTKNRVKCTIEEIRVE